MLQLQISPSVALLGSLVKMNCDNLLNTEQKQMMWVFVKTLLRIF